MPPKKVDKAARRRDILAAAAGIFARHGYRKATIDQVAEAAGISKGAVYLSFGSKEDLFYALFEQLTHDAMAAPPPADAVGSGALARIEALFGGVMVAIDANEALIPLTLEFWSACGVDETRGRFGPRYAQLFDEFRQALATMIEDGKRSGELAPALPAVDLASCLMAMIDGLLLQQWTDPAFKASSAMATALPVVLRSLRADD